MKPTLYIRLQSPQPDAPTAYCELAPQSGASAQHSWPVAIAPLSEVLARAAGARLFVLVPADDVRLTRVTVPARGAAKVLQATPFALEDQLAEDVDDLHFALGPQQPDGSHPVAVVSRARMDEWLGLFRNAGLHPECLIPETFCLPAAQDDRWTGLAEGGHVMIRTGAYSGFGCPQEDLPLLLSLAAAPETRPTLQLSLTQEQATDYTRLDWPVELRPGFSQALQVLLPNLELRSSINLLQNRYAPTESLKRLWQPWRAAAALAGVALLLAGVTRGVEAYTLGRELSELQTQNEQRFRTLFPAETRIVNLEAQVEQQAAALQSGGSGASSWLALMEQLTQGLSNTPGLTLQGVQYRERALFVSLVGTDLQGLEQLRAHYENHSSVLLDVQSANSGADGVQIRLKLSAR